MTIDELISGADNATDHEIARSYSIIAIAKMMKEERDERQAAKKYPTAELGEALGVIQQFTCAHEFFKGYCIKCGKPD